MSARSVHRDVDEQALSAYCALAKQCFINNYVFQIGQDEQDLARNLRASLTAAIAAKTPIDALMLAATACYFRLCDLPDAASLLDQNWPKPVAALLEQQVAAPLEESRLRAAIPCLTPITDAVSIAVREQYEQNPYPQWMKLPRGDDAKPLHKYFHERFPMSPFKQMENGRDEIDILIAGCGTGQQSIEAARRFTRSKVLAVDLSMASLCYAARQTRALGQENIRYAQADIMRLGETGLSFDVIESTGVLHHLADPLSGWRVLLSLLRPGGVMFVALYSEIARRDIVAAQNHAAARGYRPTPGDIRRCRADIIESPPGSPLRNVMAARDFFSLDECRDLLFHVQESRFTLPQIASFLAENGLDLIGFELEPSVWRGYSQAFPADQAMTNLTNWHAYETKHPDTFFGMYNFWIQKRRNSGQ
jgi:2-polyprenyl-3-methyl-5-hydroxy-6-metoxy-1,4-benzoquinol methylase